MFHYVKRIGRGILWRWNEHWRKIRRYFNWTKYRYRRVRSACLIARHGSARVPEKPGEIRLFAKMRNESLRLPYFLRYYTDLGVDRFVLIDNCSDDETADIALAHSKVHLFKTRETYLYHWNWMETMLDRYGKGHWCVVADIDELLCFPHSERIDLKQLARFLDREDSNCLEALLLDVYGRGPITQSHYEAGRNPLEVCQYFDPEYEEKTSTRNFNPRDRRKFQTRWLGAGVRQRVFGLRANLLKIPLFYHDGKTYLRRGMHGLDGARLSGLRGVVFHTKYLHDFAEKAKREAERSVYFNNASEYRRYVEKLALDPELSFWHPHSIRYTDTADLVDRGFMRTTPAFEKFLSDDNQ